MIYPLENNPRVTSRHGEVTNMGRFGKHIGIDRSVSYKPFFAPSNGVVKMTGSGGSGGLWVEVLIGKYLWRFLHLSRIYCKVGEKVSEGEMLGITGNSGVTTGAHLHYDARIAGTRWSDSFSNYVDPDALIERSRSAYSRLVGLTIKLHPKNGRWNVYKAGTTTKLGTLIDDGALYYIVRGTDPKYPNRVLINSKQFGNMIALPLANVYGVEYLAEWSVA